MWFFFSENAAGTRASAAACVSFNGSFSRFIIFCEKRIQTRSRATRSRVVSASRSSKLEASSVAPASLELKLETWIERIPRDFVTIERELRPRSSQVGGSFRTRLDRDHVYIRKRRREPFDTRIRRGADCTCGARTPSGRGARAAWPPPAPAPSAAKSRARTVGPPRAQPPTPATAAPARRIDCEKKKTKLRNQERDTGENARTRAYTHTQAALQPRVSLSRRRRRRRSGRF